MTQSTTASVGHTPGPWRVQRHTTSTKGAQEPLQIYGEGWAAVASMPNFFPPKHADASKHDGAIEANARLIAAAPDLLAALADLVPLIEAEYPHQQHVWLQPARAAIAKAEGRTE